MQYGQFCPIAKATEILGEKWTILIVRELLMGGRRFTELQRGLGVISPTILTARLKALEDHGLAAKRRIPGQRGHEYFPTESCQELLPIIMALGEWAKSNLSDDDYDVELLMLYLERSVLPEKLPGRETVIRFEFTDLKQHRDWWLVIADTRVDVCVKDPGRDVDVFFTTDVRTMTEVWLGRETYRAAVKSGALTIVGPAALTRNVRSWLRNSEWDEAIGRLANAG